MFESTIAVDCLALPEAANEAFFDRCSEPPAALLVGSDLTDVLEAVGAISLRRRARTVRFRDSGAAMFRPFRIY